MGTGVAENMMSGKVHVKGNASQSAGATAHGGLLIIDGDASADTSIASAAADGVGARKSTTKSVIVKSISCPMPETQGMLHSDIVRANFSLLKAHKSSIDPPPLTSNSTSQVACC